MASWAGSERRSVTTEVWIDVSPQRVFRALTDPRDILCWWGAPEVYRVEEFRLDPRVGGRWSLRALGFRKDTFEVSGEVVEYSPPRSLAFTWKPGWEALPTTTVRFELTEERGGTRLRLVHSGFPRDSAGLEEHLYGWPWVLEWLGEFLRAA